MKAEGTVSNKSIYEKKREIKEASVHYSLLHSVLWKFVMFVRKTEWFLSDQSFPLFRESDHKRPHYLLRGVLKSVVKGP